MKQKKFIALLAVVMVLVLSVSIFAACGNKEHYDYSYRIGPSDLPTAWNLHTYQSNSSTYILDYCGDALYTFDYKDANCDAFTIVPSMASDFPTDITSQVSADAQKAEWWDLYSDELAATADAEGEYVVEAAALDENGKGIVGEDDYDSYKAAYDDYIAAGALVRVKLEKAPATENRVYSIPLKHNLKFDNGAAITANTFVESMQLLLQPDAVNYRADNVYKTGNLKIAGAEEYFKAGKITLEDLTTNGNGVGEGEYTGWNNSAAGYGLSEEIQKKIFFVTSTNSYVGAWAADWSGKDVDWTYGYLAKNYGGATEDRDTVLIPCYKEMNEKSLYELLQDGAGFEYTYEDEEGEEQTAKLLYKDAIDYLIAFWCTDPDEEFGFFCAEYTWPAKDFETVGFYAADDYTLVVVLKNAMEDNFYLRHELCTSFFLVYPDLYKKCISYKQGVYNNNYGTSVKTYVGYGPYKLSKYVADSTIVLTRNDNWHGYDPEDASYKEGTYQADRIVYKKVTENSTRLEMFLKGELDSYGLQPEDMKDYITSSYVVFTESESTWYMAMNPDEAKLAGLEADAKPVTEGNTVVKRVLCLDDFRKALSYSIDRNAFNLVTSPTSGIAKALLSSMFIYDPEQGLTYRSTDQAKDAILSFWGVEWGEGTDYPDRDAAIASITGYDPAGAKELFTAAYNQGRAAGYIPEGNNWEVQIVVGRPSANEYYQRGFDFFKANWTDAVKDTPFEGHLELVFSQILGSTSFGTYLREGNVDLLFGVGFGSSMFDPYGTMDVYTGSLQYDPFTDKTKVYLDITFDFGAGEKTYRASLYDWVSEALQGNKITITEVDADGNGTENKLQISAGTSDPIARRLAILAAAEEKVLSLANIFPLQTDASASLRCMRVNYKTDEYVLGMGFGGIQYYTFSMTDAEYAKYVKSQGGHLNYMA